MISELLEVLRWTRELLGRPENDFVLSHWRNGEEAVRELDSFTEQLSAGNMKCIRELTLLFAPTGSIQEVSLSSGWADEFLAVAERLDLVIKRV